MSKMGVCGFFSFEKELLNGQTIKTKILAKELQNQFGEDEVKLLDFSGGVKDILKISIQSFKMLLSCDNIVILPAQNSLKFFVPFFWILNRLAHKKLYYSVIGGWLSEWLKKHLIIAHQLKRFDGVYAETNTMKQALEKQGFTNVTVIPNCKALSILEESELYAGIAEPYKLCTFSRVMKEKGIEDAIEAVSRVNDFYGRIVYTLDIYGQVDINQSRWFDELQKKFPSFVKYNGAVPFDKTVDVLKGKFALLFPTRFYTEGVPGTIIDAYAAGVPVISSIWESFSDVVDDNKTGIGYEFLNNTELYNILVDIAVNPDKIYNMKANCLKKAHDFLPENALIPLISAL